MEQQQDDDTSRVPAHQPTEVVLINAPVADKTLAVGFATERKQRSNSAYVFAVKEGKLTWTFPEIGTLVFDPDKASAINRARAMVFGFKQRINDAAALDADASGKVDPKAKFAEMERMIAHYEAGGDDWTLKPQADKGAGSMVTQALVALGTYQGRDVSDTEKANAFVKAVAEAPKLKAQLKGEMAKARGWLEANSKQIREKIAELKAAQAPAVDADAELEALMGEPTE